MADKKTRLIVKIILTILVIISLTIGVFEIYYMFSENKEVPYFFNHFGIAIVLFCVGGMAFLMPMITQKRYQDDSKDQVMVLVAALLVLAAIFSIIMSYFNWNFFAS